ITERKRAEEALRAAEERYRLLAYAVKSADECISITDTEDRILYVNGGFFRPPSRASGAECCGIAPRTDGNFPFRWPLPRCTTRMGGGSGRWELPATSPSAS